MASDDVAAIGHLRDAYQKLKVEPGKIIVGQDDVIERLAICLFARGHALLMGVPGLAKTLLISRVAEAMTLDFSRIQFTPDLGNVSVARSSTRSLHVPDRSGLPVA